MSALNISSQLSKVVYPLKPFYSPCPATFVYKLVVIPESEQTVIKDYDNRGDDKIVNDDDQDVDEGHDKDDVKTSVWSTVGWSLGCFFTLFILVIVCLRIYKMVRRNLVRQPNHNTTEENIYDLSENIYRGDNSVYRDSTFDLGSESQYANVRI
ncbi:hypothetical protein LOTGIDRAFT_165509 [Lottia gigantea]|uniref:Uncharacterized protein n=1 Tax=Lottia gigantea TaxID=225164 RepID=V4A1B5_LOTGI|nr:hypothetical protein LOTGIDRAFT_165509 [Lottia gigantea]ESO88725.1 hypothetical protein LOTGIDRAFT_165509 [Lottia gigantea]